VVAVVSVTNDPDLLLDGFRERVLEVMALMRERGHEPRLFETRRTKERAAELHARGTGSANSMHCYDVAADIICARQLWNASARFWADLEDIAESIGLVRLYKRGIKHDGTDANAESWDKPHVQACAVSEQNELRAMTRDERSAWCRQRFGA
jgi:hypothetical protein